MPTGLISPRRTLLRRSLPRVRGSLRPLSGLSTLSFALIGGGLTAVLVLYEMLTREGALKTLATGAFVAGS